MKKPIMHKVWKAELRVMTRADRADTRETKGALKTISREIAKLQNRYSTIHGGLEKRAAIRAHRISILEGRLHS